MIDENTDVKELWRAVRTLQDQVEGIKAQLEHMQEMYAWYKWQTSKAEGKGRSSTSS